MSFIFLRKSFLLCIWIWGVFCLLSFSVLAQLSDVIPEGGIVQKGDSYVAEEAAGKIQIPVWDENHLRLRARTGKEPMGLRVVITVDGPEGKKGFGTAVEAAAVSVPGEKEPHADGQLVITWPFAEGRTSYYTRPNLSFYTPEQRTQIDWEKYPAASTYPVTFEVRQEGDLMRFWIDGKFVHERQAEGQWTQVDLYLEKGAVVEGVEWKYDADIAPVRQVEIKGKSLSDGKLLWDKDAASFLPPGMQLPKSLSSVAVAKLGQIKTANVDFSDLAMRRNGLQALPDTWITSLPLAPYHRAWVLCVAEEDPEKERDFTLRLTRYGESRGDGIADTHVQVPAINSPATEESRRMGTLEWNGKKLPIWLLRVPLRVGEIQDLLEEEPQQLRRYGYMSNRYLEIEALDRLPFRQSYADFPPNLELRDYSTIPKERTSGVHLLGLAVEETPAALSVHTQPRFAAFYETESPKYEARVKARQAGKYLLTFEIADVNGKIVHTETQPVTLKASEESVVEFPVKIDKGWYASRVVLSDSDSSPLVDYRSSFVMLPPDKRQAGVDSPFGTWWFNWAHGGTPSMEMNGPVFQRAGLRKTILATTNAEKLPESVTAPYQVYLNAIPWMRVPAPERKKMSIEERLAKHEEFIRRHKQAWPSVDRILIWHESGAAGAPLPSELWGEEAPPVAPLKESTWYQETWEERLAYLPRLAKLVREKFPDLKMQYGNDGNSLSSVGQLLRSKFPREWIDRIAVENLGLVTYPEAMHIDGLQSLWFLRETARKLGYGDIPVTACYEWINRRDYGEGRGGALGLRQQAEWYVRDAIHALAYGVDSISLGSLHDAGNGYYYSIYGAGGFTRRYPEMQPKPAYAAIATLTQVLDRARPGENRLTDCLSLHVQEFRKDNEWIYALWTERGERVVECTFEESSAAVRRMDLYGKEQTLPAGEAIKCLVGTGVQYLISPTKLASVTPGKAEYPEEPVPTSLKTVDTMQSGWELRPGYETLHTIPQVRPGAYQLHAIEDEERGQVWELTQEKDEAQWGPTFQSTILRLDHSGDETYEASGVGVWVKGNGSGAEIRWIIRNEDGKEWMTGDWDTYRYRNMGWFSINFNGWHYIKYPLDKDPRWKGRGAVVGLAVAMPRQRIHGTELVDVSPTLRLSGLSFY